ncbi:glycosyltransferase family 4 protein [Tolumonas osonensis]|uniref:Glycosyltransferase involved in cell wall biosynthesis n=1 Tax=Tolumonas osonensis TaxID=675874 RepID=A0A841GQQ4_9GAMM|nr:glycosyltransferase family 4 protein [Tolumonas osonensis]MBB6056912.1 glycosyltransferase involved in cell wall biosynthesis [Tolumonas osonensis]
MIDNTMGSDKLSNDSMTGINIIYHTIKPGGGMERYALDLIENLSARNIPLRVIARKISWPGIAPSSVEFVKVPDFTPFSRINKHLFDITALKYINNAWPTIGLTRVSGPTDIAVVGGTHKGFLNAVKKTHHGIFDYLTIKRETSFYKHAKCIVAHSRQVGQEVIDHYQIDKDKLHIIYPPVSFSSFSLDARKERAQIRKELGIQHDQILLLFPSNNHDRKGLDLILGALEKADKRFVLAIASRKAVTHPRVINLGFRNDMPALYAAADAAILASKYEPFGLVGPEAVLCGTPVILANTVGATEVIAEPACTRFQRTTESLTEALEKFLRMQKNAPLILSQPDQFMPQITDVDQHCSELLKLLKYKD